MPENTVSTVSTVSIVRDNDHDPRSSQPLPGPIGAAETTAIDPRARPQTVLTVLTQKPAFSR